MPTKRPDPNIQLGYPWKKKKTVHVTTSSHPPSIRIPTPSSLNPTSDQPPPNRWINLLLPHPPTGHPLIPRHSPLPRPLDTLHNPLPIPLARRDPRRKRHLSRMHLGSRLGRCLMIE